MNDAQLNLERGLTASRIPAAYVEDLAGRLFLGLVGERDAAAETRRHLRAGAPAAPRASYLNVLATGFEQITETLRCPHPIGTHTYVKIIRTGIHEEPNNPKFDMYILGLSILYQDGTDEMGNGELSE